MMTGVQTSGFELQYLPYGFSAFGRESTSSRRLQQSSHICVLERNPEAWSNTECRPDGCKLEQFEASRRKGRSGLKFLVVRTNDVVDSWTSKRYDTSSGRLPGNRIFCLANCAESSGSTSE
jgi:hypothetical protein